MADVPYPLTGNTIEELKQQMYQLIRNLYEDKIGGADVGDVFYLSGDVLTLALDGDSLEKSTNGLKVGQSSAISDPAGGATVDAEARTAINAILDLLHERGLMA